MPIVRPGVHTCAPLKEGILCLANSNSQGKLFLMGESGTVVPLLTGAAFAPPSHADAGMLHARSFSRQWGFFLEGAHHH